MRRTDCSGSLWLPPPPVIVGKMCAVRVSGSSSNVTSDYVGSLSKSGTETEESMIEVGNGNVMSLVKKTLGRRTGRKHRVALLVKGLDP